MRRILTATAFLLVPSSLLAGDWPQWRGPNRDGIAQERVEPWQGAIPAGWRVPVGEGHSSPIVTGGRVFIHAKVTGAEKEEVVAIDAATGRPIWRFAYDRVPYKNEYGNGPRATPLVDGDRLYTLGVTGILTCWEAATGKQVWQMDILKEFHAPNLFFGVSMSPLIDADKLLVMPGGPDASIVALDKMTGKVLWKSGSDKASYASPILLRQKDQRMAVFLTQEGVAAFNPADGKRIWQFPLKDKLSESSTTPVALADMLVASSVTFGSVGLKLTDQNGQPGCEQAWKNERLSCYFSTPVAVGDQLYLVSGQLLPLPAAHLNCVDAKSGKILWTHKNVGKYHATVLLAKDRLLLLEEEGALVLIEPNAQEYKELARSKVCGHTWAHPALSDGRLFVRDDKELICLLFGKSAVKAEPMTLQEKVDQIVQPYLTDNKAVGVVVGVVTKDGRQTFGYGKMAPDSEKEPNGDTIFEIGSITKVFTAMLLADMAEDGLVKLDDPVQKYLPETVKMPKRGDTEMTLLHLATHTSGLPRVPIALTLKNPKNPYAAIGAADVYDFLSSCQLIHDVGTTFEYSNLGGGLLGHVLSLKANQPYEDLIIHRIADPLGMKDTRITLSASQKERLAPGHTNDCKPTGNWDFDALAGCGALRSSTNDLLTFASANLGWTKSRLDSAIAACKKSRHASPLGEVGLGWMMTKGKDDAFVWHNGGTGGYSSFVGISEKHGFGVVVLANNALSLKGSVADLVGGEVAKVLTERK